MTALRITALIDYREGRYVWGGVDITDSLTTEQRAEADAQVASWGQAEFDVKVDVDGSVTRGYAATRIDPEERAGVEDLVVVLDDLDVTLALSEQQTREAEAALVGIATLSRHDY